MIDRPLHRVQVEPDGLVLEVKDGQTIFRAAHDTGIEWPTRCGGAKQCTVCTVIVLKGAENLSAADGDERFRTAALIRRLEVHPSLLRMACAARVRGPVVVQPRHKLGLEEFVDEQST